MTSRPSGMLTARLRARQTSVAIGAALLVLATSVACSGEPDDPGTEVVTRVEVAATYENFGYYNPCANQPLEIGDATLYPLLDEEIAALDRDRYVPATPGTSLTGMARVAPPGPGDDVGTMTVYIDGVARFETANGDEWWFNDQERTYNWEC